jgi:hypothetical protein
MYGTASGSITAVSFGFSVVINSEFNTCQRVNNTNPTVIGCENGRWRHLPKDRKQWPRLVFVVSNFRIILQNVIGLIIYSVLNWVVR